MYQYMYDHVCLTFSSYTVADDKGTVKDKAEAESPSGKYECYMLKDFDTS